VVFQVLQAFAAIRDHKVCLDHPEVWVALVSQAVLAGLVYQEIPAIGDFQDLQVPQVFQELLVQLVN